MFWVIIIIIIILILILFCCVLLLIDLLFVYIKNKTGFKEIKLDVLIIEKKGEEYELNQKTFSVLHGIKKKFKYLDKVDAQAEFKKNVRADCKVIKKWLSENNNPKLSLITHSKMLDVMNIIAKAEPRDEPDEKIGYTIFQWKQLTFRTLGKTNVVFPESFDKYKINYQNFRSGKEIRE
ncbi:hypothetical protein ACFVP8_03900 [Viridibacillus arvi]|uniref:hypothetical protein n=1 Tax=Viridibacillus arvi TaxID=263475 RepID=UPI0036C5CAA9